MAPDLELATTSTRVAAFKLQTPSDLDEWDAWLRDDTAGHYRHASWWLESLRRLGIEGTIIAVRSGERFVGGAAILEFGFQRGGIRIHSILHGPVIAPGEEEALDSLVEAIRDHARVRKAALVQFAAVPREDTLEFIASKLPEKQLHNGSLWNAYATPDPFCSLSLQGSEDMLLGSLSQSARRKIRKGQGLVHIRRAECADDFREAHRTWQMSSDRKSFLVRPFESAGHAMQQAVRKDMGTVYLATVNGVTAASIFVVWSGVTGHYVSGGFDPAFASHGCSYLLQWEAIKDLHLRGLATYDLGNYSEDGVGQFKLSLGAQIQHIERSIAWVRRPILWKAISMAMRPSVLRHVRRWARKNAGFNSMEEQQS